MRIIGEIPHGSLKITVFKMNDKVSIKVEKNISEIILKFRDGDVVNDLNTAHSFLTPSVLVDLENQLEQIVKIKSNQVSKLLSDNKQIFPDIL